MEIHKFRLTLLRPTAPIQHGSWFFGHNITVPTILQYNNTVDGPYTIKTGKDDIDQFTRILSYQNSTELTYWNSSYCNMLNGTDGISYPPNTGEVDRVFIFNKDLCRSGCKTCNEG